MANKKTAQPADVRCRPAPLRALRCSKAVVEHRDVELAASAVGLRAHSFAAWPIRRQMTVDEIFAQARAGQLSSAMQKLQALTEREGAVSPCHATTPKRSGSRAPRRFGSPEDVGSLRAACQPVFTIRARSHGCSPAETPTDEDAHAVGAHASALFNAARGTELMWMAIARARAALDESIGRLPVQQADPESRRDASRALRAAPRSGSRPGGPQSLQSFSGQQPSSSQPTLELPVPRAPRGPSPNDLPAELPPLLMLPASLSRKPRPDSLAGLVPRRCRVARAAGRAALFVLGDKPLSAPPLRAGMALWL